MNPFNNKTSNNIIGKFLKHYDTPGKYEMFEISEIIVEKSSPKQLIQILNLKDEGKSFLLNEHFQITEASNNPYHEFLIMISVVFISNKKPKFLISGGGDGVALSRLRMFNSNSKIDLVEYDDEVIKTAKNFLSDWNNDIFNCGFGNIIIEDSIEFVKNYSGVKYDSIICDLTPPHSGCNPAFWTSEFLKCLKNILVPYGNLAMLGDHINIKSDHNVDFLFKSKELFNTVFPLINPFTGSCIFFLSDRKSSLDSLVEEMLRIKPSNFSSISKDSILSAIYTGKALLS